MKKFEEICEAYERHLTNSQGYKDRSIDFAKNLVNGFMSYCEIPKEQLKIQKVDEEREEDYHPDRLVNLMEIKDDSFCHLWIRLIVYPGSSMMVPKNSILIKFRFKEEGSNFILKLNPGLTFKDQGYKISSESDTSYSNFQEVYNFISDTIYNNFENGLERFLAEEAQDRIFGYS